MVKALDKNAKWQGRNGPVVLVIMDGVGYGKFTEGDAVSLLPIIRRITEHTAEEVDALQEQLRFVPHDEPLHKRLYAQVEATVRRWAIKVSKLGCEPRGIWLVDFDAGEGWYTWRLGDEGLTFFHSHARPAGADAPSIPREFPS